MILSAKLSFIYWGWSDVLTFSLRSCGLTFLLVFKAATVDLTTLICWPSCLHSWWGVTHCILASTTFDMPLLSLLSDIHIILIFEFFNWVLNFVQIISFLQEVTLFHPKRNIKNHAVMFWNASFAHSQTLNYPENLRYVRWFSSANWPFGTHFSSYFLFTISFCRPVLQIAKEKMSLTLPAWENIKVDNVQSFFESNLKSACC